jgi:hypothetical protein
MAIPHRVSLSSPELTKAFSPVDNEPPLRWQRAVRLAPASGLGVARRAIVLAALTWLPIALWAVVRGRFIRVSVGEPILQHYAVHVRCLVAIPLMILGEATLHRAATRYFPQFSRNGLVDDATRPRFEDALSAARRWRDSSLPWLFVGSVALSWTLIDHTALHTDAMSWAFNDAGTLGFGGLWFAYVVRPLFVALVLGWLWRIVLLVMLFVRLGKLDFSLVPSHPDRAGGLGFLENLPAAFGPVSFALSATLASRWAHQVVYHAQTLQGIKLPAIAFVVVWSLLLLMPLVPLASVLWAAKRVALPSYAAMVAEQGRLVRRRWIDGTMQADSPLLEPAGVGPIADAATMYSAVRSMRILMVSRRSLLGILLPVAVPMLVVVGLQIPIWSLLLGVVKALM